MYLCRHEATVHLLSLGLLPMFGLDSFTSLVPLVSVLLRSVATCSMPLTKFLLVDGEI